LDVHEDHVGLQGGGLCDRLVAGRRFAHYLKVGQRSEEGTQSLAEAGRCRRPRVP
jgi:hypothetical protein